MHLRKKNVFKALILTKASAGRLVSLSLGVIFVIVAVTLLNNISGNDLIKQTLDIFLIRNRASAEFAEFFTDSDGFVYTIIDDYTMLVSEKEAPQTAPEPKAYEPPVLQEITTEERTISSVSELKNQSGKEADINTLINQPLYFSKEGKSPCVLIIHTHTTESYYETDRSLDENKNMIAIGAVIAEKLKSAGIDVIHDTTVHDYPSYNNAYSRSAATVKNNLASNPQINVVLDVHRDAVASTDGKKLSLVTEIDGKKLAQIMFVVGTDAQLAHPNWQENLKLALKLQEYANRTYPSLMRPINLREQRFNQQLSAGSVIIEVGCNGNTLDEAKSGAELMGDVLSKVLLQ